MEERKIYLPEKRLRVFCRLRPISKFEHERERFRASSDVEAQKILVKGDHQLAYGRATYHFDRVFGSDLLQDQVMELV